MKTLSRIKNILKININEILYYTKNSEEELQKLIEKMEVNLGELKTHILEESSREKNFFDAYRENKIEIANLEKKIMQLIKQKREEIAKEALKKKIKLEDLNVGLKKRWEEQTKHTSKLYSYAEEMEEKIKEARNKLNAITLKSRFSNIRKGIKIGEDDMEKFEKDEFLEEAENELDETPEKKFEKLEKMTLDERVELEFNKIKNNIEGGEEV